ncbi:hypothetical protein Tco_0384417, partial [Tanacetum coccineum]
MRTHGGGCYDGGGVNEMVEVGRSERDGDDDGGGF